jgi:outer membrane lipoprotein carrier protein
MIYHTLAGRTPIPAALALILLLASPFPSRTAFAQTAQEAVAAVEDHYSGVNELTAKVVQKNLLKAIGKTQTFEGTLSIKKPGRLRLDYTNGQIILVDGKTALFYSKKSAQLVKKTFADVQQMNIPLAFLLGAAHIRDDFDVLQPDPSTPRSLELLPKSPGAAMKKLGLRTDDAGRITGLTIFDKSGNISEIALSEVREGGAVDERLFVFKPPRGTEIIEQ